MSRLNAVATVCAVVLLDIFTKRAAVNAVSRNKGQRVPLLGKKLYLSIVKNSGAAYNIGNETPELVKLLSLGGLIFMVCYTVGAPGITAPVQMKLFKLGGSLAVGGGAANLLDRFRNGYVTDFIKSDNESIPVFNLADLFVTAGALLMFCAASASK